MKTSITPAFNPVTIVIETPEELAKIYALLNQSSILTALDLWGTAAEFREVIKDAGGRPAYEEYHRKLTDIISNNNK